LAKKNGQFCNVAPGLWSDHRSDMTDERMVLFNY